MSKDLNYQADIEKEKEEILTDYILDFKGQRGYLPKNLLLHPDFIPKKCYEKMAIEIDDQEIPISIQGAIPC